MSQVVELTIQCEYAGLVPLKELKPHPKNRNNHSEEQIQRLAEVIRYQGFRHPIIVSTLSGFICAGHGRLEAAKKLGLKEVPVDYQDFENEDQEYAFLVSDNSIALWAELDFSGINADIAALGPDFDIDLLGIKNFVIEPADKADPGCDEDEAPEPPSHPKSNKGDLFELGNHRLYCGDATLIDDLEILMGGKKCDLVVTDPPYNVDYTGKTKDALKIQNDKMDQAKFLEFLQQVYSNLFMVTKDGCSIYVAHADTEGHNFRSAMVDSGWLLKQCLVWVKQTFVMGRQDYHWKHEPILYGWKPGKAHRWFTDRKQSTVLEFNKPSRNGEHPTMKPVELIEYLVSNSSEAGEIVVDVFGGSGSTLIACEKARRKCFTMELDPKYVDVILNRFEKYSGKKAYRIAEDGAKVPWSEV